MSYLTHLETSAGKRLAADTPHTAAPGETLHACYDLDRIRREVSPRDIAQGPASLWRYASLLPVDDPHAAVTLNEGYTPLVPVPRIARALGLTRLAVKDEGRNPSGTFKDRGASVAVSRYVELGVKTVAHNSSGNAGGSWSLYAARAGITCVNLLPTNVQPASLQHCRASGQPAFLVENWHDAGRMVTEACERNGWLNICTLKEPYRLEGKKTMGLEIAEQLGCINNRFKGLRGTQIARKYNIESGLQRQGRYLARHNLSGKSDLTWVGVIFDRRLAGHRGNRRDERAGLGQQQVVAPVNPAYQ